MPLSPPIKVLLAKIGLDGHDRGFRLIGFALREAGMEVVLGGPWCTIDEVISTAIQEDLEVIAISSLSFDHLLIPKLMERIRAEQLDVLVVVGGIVPQEDVPALLTSGVGRVFHPGSTLKSIVEYLDTEVAARRSLGVQTDEFHLTAESR